MKVDVIKAKAHNYGNKRYVTIKLGVTDCDVFEDVKYLNHKLEQNTWMYKHLLEFAPFDYSYNLRLFADSLEVTGKDLIKHGQGVNSIKDGRRCVFAGHLLRSCLDESMYTDKAIDALHSRTSISWKRISSGMHQMCTQYLYANAMNMNDEEYDTKMHKIAWNRCKKVDKDRWENAFNYIKKYCRHFWW